MAARERATGGRVNREGADGSLVVYASSETHSSIEKAVRIAGLGSAALRQIAIDERRAMSPEALSAAIRTDRSEGRRPCAVVATAGTTSTAACDPVDAIAEVCAREGLWLHVDAAYAGSAAVCPELRRPFRGSERADSWSFNPHKWLLTHFDASVLWVADRRSLIEALSILPEYLRNAATASGAVTDYRDWQIPLGRRFRALKLWAVLRWYGREGLQAHIRHHVELARKFAAWVQADPDFELMAPVDFALVCFRHRRGDAVNAAILGRCSSRTRVSRVSSCSDSRSARSAPRSATSKPPGV
jgi:aromatic-L-amino-acid decarboxylase